MSNAKIQCKNCDELFDKDFKFCPHCGQKADNELTLGILFYNTISNYFSFDARFFKSFIPLLFKPGYLAKEFVKGKRLLFLHPAQMYLFISLVFFFVFSFSVRKQTDAINKELEKDFKTEIVAEDDNNALDTIASKKTPVDLKTKNENSSKISKATLDSIRTKDSLDIEEFKRNLKSNPLVKNNINEEELDSILSPENLKNPAVDFSFNKIDSLVKANAPDKEVYKALGLKEGDGWIKRKLAEQVLKFYKQKNGGDILKAFYDTLPIALFFLLPIFALILKLLYFKRGKYAHHLVFSFYYFSFLFTVFTFIFGVDIFYDMPDVIDWILALSTFIYLFLALKKYYEQGFFKTWLKSTIATFTFLLFILPITGVFLFFIAFLIY